MVQGAYSIRRQVRSELSAPKRMNLNFRNGICHLYYSQNISNRVDARSNKRMMGAKKKLNKKKYEIFNTFWNVQKWGFWERKNSGAEGAENFLATNPPPLDSQHSKTRGGFVARNTSDDMFLLEFCWNFLWGSGKSWQLNWSELFKTRIENCNKVTCFYLNFVAIFCGDFKKVYN